MRPGDPFPGAGSEALAVACSLDASELADRVAEFECVFASALVSYEREPTQLQLSLSVSGGDEVHVHDLFRREAECCPFFKFRIARDENALLVMMRVPEGAEQALDDFERLARARRT